MRLTMIPLLAVCFTLSASAQSDWKPVEGKLMTRWAKNVSPDNVHPEYPRPQMVREKWQNLNGLWDYAIKPKAETQPASFDGKILVPFPVESALSGVAKRVGPDNKLWYHRTFAVPADWRKDEQRLLLHFGACDWDTTVYVNGKEVGKHRGGYDPFSFDITDALSAEGDQKLVVEVWDPSNDGYQPRGKQVREPRGIWYTPTTGIWQTVWMEPVPAKDAIHSFTIDTDVDAGELKLKVDRDRRSDDGMSLVVQVKDGDKVVSTSTIQNFKDETIVVEVPERKLWSPASPHLYQMRISVGKDGAEASDTVDSYFAFRKLSIAKDDAGIPRLMLNDKFVFQYGPLDQGFWPDGLYTAPTHEAMVYDLEVTKRLGFNMVRKHVKTEPATWYHACDKMGLLVWQDMPNGDAHVKRNAAEDFKRSPESMANYEQEWTAIIKALRNHPSIVMWVPFNEGWGQSDTARIATLTRKLDPTRWVNSASGWVDRGVGDVLDLHLYPGPTPPADALLPFVRPKKNPAEPAHPGRALVLGEFGGLGLPIKGHTWQDEKNWGYRSYDSPEALTDAYVTLLARLHPLIGKPGYSAAVYTQTTDVEIEVNGLMTYDRAIIKMDEGRITAAAKKLYGPPPVITTVVPDARNAEIDWRYTTDKPAEGWQAKDFDDSGWKTGKGGFGTAMTPGTNVRTEWNGKQIWVRRSFDLPAAVEPASLHLMIHHDEDAEVFINGVSAAKLTGYTTSYSLIPISPEAAKALQAGAQNTIAIQCKQSTGGQYIDAGMVSVK